MDIEVHGNSSTTGKIKKQAKNPPITVKDVRPKDELQCLNPVISGLSVENLIQAERAIVRFDQTQFFKDDITALAKGIVKKSSHLYKLDRVIVDGLLRVGGRLSKSALLIETKHPAILPKSSHTTNLILCHVHEKVGHSGRNHMLSTLHRQYWIPHANAACSKVIKDYIVCQQLFQRPGEQKMSDLPADRISTDLPPFHLYWSELLWAI